jgi:hypothetical protein
MAVQPVLTSHVVDANAAEQIASGHQPFAIGSEAEIFPEAGLWITVYYEVEGRWLAMDYSNLPEHRMEELFDAVMVQLRNQLLVYLGEPAADELIGALDQLLCDADFQQCRSLTADDGYDFLMPIPVLEQIAERFKSRMSCQSVMASPRSRSRLHCPQETN